MQETTQPVRVGTEQEQGEEQEQDQDQGQQQQQQPQPQQPPQQQGQKDERQKPLELGPEPETNKCIVHKASSGVIDQTVDDGSENGSVVKIADADIPGMCRLRA